MQDRRERRKDRRRWRAEGGGGCRIGGKEGETGGDGEGKGGAG